MGTVGAERGLHSGSGRSCPGVAPGGGDIPLVSTGAAPCASSHSRPRGVAGPRVCSLQSPEPAWDLGLGAELRFRELRISVCEPAAIVEFTP